MLVCVDPRKSCFYLGDSISYKILDIVTSWYGVVGFYVLKALHPCGPITQVFSLNLPAQTSSEDSGGDVTSLKQSCTEL